MEPPKWLFCILWWDCTKMSTFGGIWFPKECSTDNRCNCFHFAPESCCFVILNSLKIMIITQFLLAYMFTAATQLTALNWKSSVVPPVEDWMFKVRHVRLLSRLSPMCPYRMGCLPELSRFKTNNCYPQSKRFNMSYHKFSGSYGYHTFTFFKKKYECYNWSYFLC